ncbi:MAG: hypothetical protein KDH20_15845 [Rhodocyclaceae bacterium]|nr:hypothetical protein [Rhodocyclaceae bacterium]
MTTTHPADRLTQQICTGITGRAICAGIRRDYSTQTGQRPAFDSDIGAIDATRTIPAGSTRKPTSKGAIRCISTTWRRP